MNVTLQAELLHKISLLLDKPVSPKSTQQIITHIQNQISNKQKIFNLILSKFRSDLLLFMLKFFQFSIGFLSLSIKNLIKNVAQYEVQPLKQIWKVLIINFNELKQKSLYQYAFEDLLKEGLKVTNLQKKNMLFELINSNIQVLQSLGQKGLIMTIQSTYIQIFKKFQINVPFYISIVSTICKINKQKQSKALQKQEVQLQILPQIQIQDRIGLINQIKVTLVVTKAKPMHQLHKQCLLSLTQIYTYNKNEYKDLNNIYEIKRIVEKQYLYRKSTRDQARGLMNVLQQIQSNIKKQNKEKAVKQYKNQQKSEDSNVLIENVINKTNQYLAKYNIKNIEKDDKLIYNDLMGKSTNIFLKKGEGVGGGKTFLQDSPTKNKNKQISSIIQRKDKYDILLEECLNNVNVSQKKQKKQQKKIIQNKISNKKQKDIYSVDDVGESQSIFVQRDQKNKKYQKQSNNYHDYHSMSNSNTTVDLQNRQDEQINQVNELIDLAYSYKFSV